MYSWSFSIVRRYKKRRTGIKSPFISFQYAEELKSHSAKKLTNIEQCCSKKGIAIATHSNELQAYNPYKTCTGVDQTTYASKVEARIESITSLMQSTSTWLL